MTRTARWTSIAALAASIAVAACSSAGASTGSPAASAASATQSIAPASTGVAAATSSPSSPSSPASGAASAGTGGSATGNDRCATFTTAQVNALTGDAPFQTSQPTMLDVPGCQWYFNSGAGNVDLQILPGSQYGDWSGKPGVTPVSGVGDSAFVGPYVLGGTMAGAQVGGTFYFLTVSPAPSNDVVVGFLKQAIAQAGGS